MINLQVWYDAVVYIFAVERLQLGRKTRSRSRSPLEPVEMKNRKSDRNGDLLKVENSQRKQPQRKITINDSLPYDCYLPVTTNPSNNATTRVKNEQLV